MPKSKTISIQGQIPQQVFNQWIDVLIMFKQSNPDKDVYLSKNSLNEAIEWYNTMKDNILNNMSEEDIKKATDIIKNTDTDII